jgi:ABC-type glutathione transport system ATPase component
MNVLEVSDLTVRFRQDGRSIEAVRNVSFTVGDGTVDSFAIARKRHRDRIYPV